MPGRFVCLPGYEWSGNTGMGGDRNIFFRREGRPIRRSSHILVDGQTSTEAVYTADELFRALAGEDAVVIAHVGGRYADLDYAHDGRLERAVEVHSTWGTFEWLLHDAFEKGYRVGVVCHSDDHKGRPGATRPGASTFGAIGGLTCYFMPELTRDAVLEALRKRRHYGTTGTRLFLDLRATFDGGRHGVLGGSAARARQMNFPCARRSSVTSSAGRRADAACGRGIGTAPVERLEVLHGTRVGADRASLCRRRSRAPCARALAGRGIPWPRPRDHVAGKIDADAAIALPVSRRSIFSIPSARCRKSCRRNGACLELGDDRQSRRHRPLARRGAARHAHAGNQHRVGRG